MTLSEAHSNAAADYADRYADRLARTKADNAMALVHLRVLASNIRAGLHLSDIADPDEVTGEGMFEPICVGGVTLEPVDHRFPEDRSGYAEYNT